MGIGGRILGGAMRWVSQFPALRGMGSRVQSMVTEGGEPLQAVVRGRAFAEFTDSDGNTFPLVEGLRKRLSHNPHGASKTPDREALDAMLSSARASVDTALVILRAHGFRISGSYVLDAGCGDGARGIALIDRGAEHVTASDLMRFHPRPYHCFNPRARDDEYEAESLESTREALLRAAFGRADDKARRITFAEDDITRSALPSGEFDLVCSWGMLGRVHDAGAAMRQTFRLLKPGGLAFHEYPAFLSLTGGGAGCTLDFPWGHAMLSAKDFGRYVMEFRPEESETAIRLYEGGLNRMSMAECGSSAMAAGLEELCMIDWPREGHASVLTEQALRLVRKLHPSATASDMVSPTVWALFRKPRAKL